MTRIDYRCFGVSGGVRGLDLESFSKGSLGIAGGLGSVLSLNAMAMRGGGGGGGGLSMSERRQRYEMS